MSGILKWSYAIYFILYLAVFAFAGIFNYAAADWDPAIFSDGAYWAKTGVESATYLIAFQVSVGFAGDVLRANHKQYNEIEAEVDRTTRSKVRPDIEQYVIEFNWKSKKEAWKKKVGNKLTKWHNRLPAKVLENSAKPKEEWTKRTKKKFKKKERLEEQLTDEWIDKYLPYKKIVYPQITVQEIFTGQKKPENKRKVIDENMTFYALPKRIVTLSLMMVVNGVMSALIISGSIFSTAVVLAIFFQLLLIMFNIFTGWVVGTKGFKEKVLTSMITRRQILLGYFEWRNSGQVKSVSDVKVSLDEVEEDGNRQKLSE